MNNVVLRGDKKCPHGHTARRKCDTCDREDDQAEIERLKALLRRIRDDGDLNLGHIREIGEILPVPQS